MPQIAVAAASTFFAASSAGGVAAFTFLGLSGAPAVLASFAVRASLGYALNALTTKGTPTSRGYQNVNQLGAALPHQVIYGETTIGGNVFYQTTNGGGSNLHRCIAFAGHEIESFEAIYLNGEEVTIDVNGFVTAPSKYASSRVRINQHLGTSDQVADSDLVSEISEWTPEHRARGVAYLYVRFSGASNFPNGIPVVTAKIRGKKIYDPRTTATAWSANPALCIRDYLISDYGLEEISANIDDVKFEDAADLCDVTLSGGPTYTCNGAFLLDASPEDIIRNLLSSMGGIFWNFGGKWAVLAAEYRTPTITLTEDDLRGPLEVATRHSRRDNFNAVRGQYKGAETNYQPDDYSEVSSGLYLAEDNDIRAATELPLLFSDTQVMAQRIARRYLRRNRLQKTVSGAFGLRALDLTIGDNVMLTIDHMGWDQKVFEVVDWRMGMRDMDIQITMILREITEEVFVGVVKTLQDESFNALADESGNNLEAIVA